MSDDVRRNAAIDADKRESEDERFDTKIPMALESLGLAINRYMLRRDAYLLIPDSIEKRRPGLRDKKIDELKAAQFSMIVQMEHIYSILKAGKL